LRRARSMPPRREVKSPVATALTYLQQQAVLPTLEPQRGRGLTRGKGAVLVLRHQFFAIEPDRQRIIAPQRHRQFGSAAALNLSVQVDNSICIVRSAEEGEVIALPVGKFPLTPHSLYAVFARIRLLQVDLFFRRVDGLVSALAGVVERA